MRTVQLEATFLVGLLLPAAAHASAQSDTTIRVSSTATGTAGNAASRDAVISADGNVVAFVSEASDLVAGDTNGCPDVFVYDRTTGMVERASVAASGAEANGASGAPALSSDGRCVAFWSSADNLDSDPNGGAITDIFLRDRTSGTTARVSFDAAGVGVDENCFCPSISGDGGTITYVSGADNIVPLPWWFRVLEVYVYDVATGVTDVASSDASGVAADWNCYKAYVAGDGSSVLFHSYGSNLPFAGLGGPGCFLKDLASGAVERVDVDSSGSTYGNLSDPWAISDDGSRVLFSTITALVPQDSNKSYDVYLRDRVAGTTVRASVATGDVEIPDHSGAASMSDDGRFVAFTSLVAVVGDDRNGVTDVYVHDSIAGTTMRASRGTLDEEGSAHAFLQAESGAAAVSADGKVVLFSSASVEFAPNDGNGLQDVFLRDRGLLVPSSTHYGVGFPGAGGVVPTLTPDHDPWRGSHLVIDASNSSGLHTVGFLLVGGARDSIPTNLGGTVLVDVLVVIPFVLAPAGGQVAGELPDAWWANGLTVDLQALEFDPLAAKGVSFTDGLELLLGDG